MTIEELEAEINALLAKKHRLFEEHAATAKLIHAKRAIQGKLRQEQAARERKEMFQRFGKKYGVLKHPKFELLCERAWDEGRSEGMECVERCFESLAELMK